MRLWDIPKGDFLENEELFEAYILEDRKYFNRVVDLFDRGKPIAEPSIEQPSDRDRAVIQSMVIGDGFWLEPFIYWTEDNWKGRFSRFLILQMESRFRSNWVRKSRDFGALNLNIPEYSIPADLEMSETAGVTRNKHFERLMQAFSILNLEWLLYVDSQIEHNVDRQRVHAVIQEAARFFSTGEVENTELMQLQIQQHRFAADWLENFLDLLDIHSIMLQRSLNGIRTYADIMEQEI